MPSPFPGMDPWLEQPGVWHSVHSRLINALADNLAQQLRPRYYVDIEQRTYLTTIERPRLIGEPDVYVVRSPFASAAGAGVALAPVQAAAPVFVGLEYDEAEVIERYLTVRWPQSGQVVTVIELLSPTNKAPGAGRVSYQTKRREILHSFSNFVEIDLLRGDPPPEVTLPPEGQWADYHILISRALKRPVAELYPFRVRDPFPRFQLPLLPRDEEPIVDLNPLLHDIYDRAGYDLVIDYTRPPEPPLSEEDAAWSAGLLRQVRG